MNAEIDVTGVTLVTKRLILRPWKQSDLEDLYEYASVDGVGQMAGWPPHKSPEESQRILDMFIAGRRTFAIEHCGKVIGSLGIEKYDEEQIRGFEDMKCREIGYVLSKDYWGQGLMPEAVGEVVRWLFEDIGLDVIFCGHFTRNRQSARVQEKCGFRHCADTRYETQTGDVEQTEVNLLTRSEWRGQ